MQVEIIEPEGSNFLPAILREMKYHNSISVDTCLRVAQQLGGSAHVIDKNTVLFCFVRNVKDPVSLRNKHT